MNGASLAGIVSGRVTQFGQALTVTRPATAQGGAVTTRSVTFLPQPLNARSAAALQLEAGFNVGEDNPYDFVCVGGSDVLENDAVSYNGFTWRVVNINPQMLGGTAVTLHCYATREKVG